MYTNGNGGGSVFSADVEPCEVGVGGFADEFYVEPDPDFVQYQHDMDMDSPSELSRMQSVAEPHLRKLQGLSSKPVRAFVNRIHEMTLVDGEVTTVSKWQATVVVGEPGVDQLLCAIGTDDDLEQAVGLCVVEFQRQWSVQFAKGEAA